MKNEKLKIISTSDLYSEPKKKGLKPILTTLDLSDEQIHKQDAESGLKPILIKDVEDKKDEKEE